MKLVGVIGSGIMGSGIAEVIAKSGIDVVIRSRSQETADATKNAIENSLKKQLAKSKITQEQLDAAMAHVCVTSKLEDLANCDLIIESVAEDLATKRAFRCTRQSSQAKLHFVNKHEHSARD